MSTRELPCRWARARTSWSMVWIPRFGFALASSVLSYDMLVCWRHLALIILIFTLIQIIAAGAVICLLHLWRRNFLIALNNRVGLLPTISRLKQRATEIARDKKAIVRFTIDTIAQWAPLCVVCIVEILAKTSMTLHARRLRVLRELARVGEVGHVSRRTQTCLRLWMGKWAPRIGLILVIIIELIVDKLRRIWTVIGRAWVALSLTHIKGLIRHVGCAADLQRRVRLCIARCLSVSYETNGLRCDWRLRK